MTVGRSTALPFSWWMMTRNAGRWRPFFWRMPARVFRAGSAAEALDMLRREHVDVLVADIAML
jgi:hypothetical protein